MNIWELIPKKSIGPVKFGMSREDVRKIFAGKYVEFRKSPLSVNTADNFGAFHVFYNQDNTCCAVEFFGDEICIALDGRIIFPSAFSDIRDIIAGMTAAELDENGQEYPDDGNYIIPELSVGIGVSLGRTESILAGEAGYYDD